MSWECPLDFENTGRYSNPLVGAINESPVGQDIHSTVLWLNKLAKTRRNAAELAKRGLAMLQRAEEVYKSSGRIGFDPWEANKKTVEEIRGKLKWHQDRVGATGDSTKYAEYDDARQQFTRAVIEWNAALEGEKYLTEKQGYLRELKDQFVAVVEKTDQAMSLFSKNYLWIGVGVVILGGVVLWMATRPPVIHMTNSEPNA